MPNRHQLLQAFKVICKICGSMADHKVDWIDGTDESIVTTECRLCHARGSCTIDASIALSRFRADASTGNMMEILAAISAACRHAKVGQ